MRPSEGSLFRAEDLVRYINLKLAALGQPANPGTGDPAFLELAGPLLRNIYQKDQLLGDRLCPADSRIQGFLDTMLAPVCPDGVPRLPASTLVLDRPGMAREMSLAPGQCRFSSPLLKSYRVAQGVLHNPASDRRTTKGVFHIVEGGLPIPNDKIAVPKQAFAKFLHEALHPPEELLALPFTSDRDEQAHLFVSLLMRPLVCPEAGSSPSRNMEIRFFAPGGLVSNLDFVETVFGNGGDPYLPENDAELDPRYWSGHTGCVVLAPHLTGMRKVDLGLPHFDQATARQRRDGMCWEKEDDRYNGGQAFKVCCRDRCGVIVTIIADNYFGYCKKEVKTQISFAANLLGLAEEEHAGGAIAYPAYVLGREFRAASFNAGRRAPLSSALRLLGELVEIKPEGYAVDRTFPDVFYVPENAEFNVRDGEVSWSNGTPGRITLLPGRTYVLPSGYRVRLEKQAGGGAWRLVGSVPHGTLCHKPCTVSGGGKSEI
jgi:phosphoenolpyruvate carboxykinase (diphosphate)